MACRKKKQQKELFRFVEQKAELVVDRDRILAGRGAYCCCDRKCLKVFLKNKKRLLRAFRCQELHAVDIDQFLDELTPLVKAQK